MADDELKRIASALGQSYAQLIPRTWFRELLEAGKSLCSVQSVGPGRLAAICNHTGARVEFDASLRTISELVPVARRLWASAAGAA